MTNFTFEPIRFKKLSELIENHVKELVIKGEIQPGDRLPSEGELGRQFGVSLVTVREALRGLEAHGLIQKKKGRGGGIFVGEVTSQSVKVPLFHFLHRKKFSSEDLTELRMMIEPAACRIAAVRIGDDGLRELEANISHCEAVVERAGSNFSADDFFAVEESNVEFHRLIGEATNNPVLMLTVEYVLDFLLTFKRTTLVPSVDFSVRIVKDHRRILARLAKRDEEESYSAMVAHLQNVEYWTARSGAGQVDSAEDKAAQHDAVKAVEKDVTKTGKEVS